MYCRYEECCRVIENIRKRCSTQQIVCYQMRKFAWKFRRDIEGEICVPKKLQMSLCFYLLILSLVVSEELPHKYMALRGYDIEGHDIKQVSASVVQQSDVY